MKSEGLKIKNLRSNQRQENLMSTILYKFPRFLSQVNQITINILLRKNVIIQLSLLYFAPLFYSRYKSLNDPIQLTFEQSLVTVEYPGAQRHFM